MSTRSISNVLVLLIRSLTGADPRENIREISSAISDELLLDMDDDGEAALAANSDEVLVNDAALLAA